MEKIAVFGLGYVGLPLAVALARHHRVVGIDIDEARVAELARGHDRTREVEPDVLRASSLRVSTNAADARGSTLFIVTVPTPITPACEPDLGPVMAATRAIAPLLEAGAGSIIVYESTVYPGVTEDICGPELEARSGLKRGRDFFLGYSPERINPGDREHGIDRIVKVVAGENPAITARLEAVYGSITRAGTFAAASIRAAEAAKVIENAQRDINIAFVNEVTTLFEDAGLSMHDVLAAARTKWNFLDFRPGLVGGHCIGVDPHYLAHFARQRGMMARMVLAGRETNETMSRWLADAIHDRLRTPSRVAVLGLTFKEDVPDLRNTKVVDLVRRLRWLGHEVVVHDPLADRNEAVLLYGLSLEQALPQAADAVVLAVPHSAYRTMGAAEIADLARPGGLFVDLRGLWTEAARQAGLNHWAV